MTTPSKGVKSLVQHYEHRSSPTASSRTGTSSRTRNDVLPIQARFIHNPKPPQLANDSGDGRLDGVPYTLTDASATASEIFNARTTNTASPVSEAMPPSPHSSQAQPLLEEDVATLAESSSPHGGTDSSSSRSTLVSSPRPPTVRSAFSGRNRVSKLSTHSYIPLEPLDNLLSELKYSPVPEVDEDFENAKQKQPQLTALSGDNPPVLSKATHKHVSSGQHHSHPGIKPVAAPDLFSRSAKPLCLPDLDHYLEKLSGPSFIRGNGPVKLATTAPATPATGQPSAPAPAKFPPLALLGTNTLSDLKANKPLPTKWKDRNTIFSLVTGWVLGLTGSGLVAKLYSLQGIWDNLQVFALVLYSISHITSQTTKNDWRDLFLGTIPNILALNVSALTGSLLIFTMLQLFTLSWVYLFHYTSSAVITDNPKREGVLDAPGLSKARGWLILVISFILMILYLPISTLTVHALVWSSDFWVVPNPYINATTFPPVLPPLGPPDEYRDPLDFCYTTTMKKDSFNYAPLVLGLSLITFGALTVYVPVRLWIIVKQCVPVVDPFTETGRPRTATEMDHEYQRLLVRDTNPLTFLYNDYRRNWGTYKCIFLIWKLVALLIVAVINADNCFFRTMKARPLVQIISEAVLVAFLLVALIVQSVLYPFVDPMSNASEWVGRLGYVLMALIGLLVAIPVPGTAILDGPILYTVYGVNYGLNGYFALAGTGWFQTLIKIITRRLDFSIDLFSPSLDISPSSIHVIRRIWQESVSVLLLASPTTQMPKTQTMTFIQAPDASYPPYLLNFAGTPAERHVENLKVLRDVGLPNYAAGADLVSGTAKDQFKDLEKQIVRDIAGPDAYWAPDPTTAATGSHFFGNAWWIPFPPTVIMRYDSGGTAILTTLAQFQEFVAQNTRASIVEKRSTRVALRALDGRIVYWPYEHKELVGTRARVPWKSEQYTMQATTSYQTALFQIQRNGTMVWQGHQLGSGFTIKLRYARDVQVDSDIIGLDDDFNLTPTLAKFLLFNKLLVNQHTPQILDAMNGYRQYLRKMAKWKRTVLSYKFLTAIYYTPSPLAVVLQVANALEEDSRMKTLITDNKDAFDAQYGRYLAVTKSPLRTWWYLLWDDLYRQNRGAVSALTTHETDFNPQYPTSVAYTPVSRPVLEAFLSQRGLLNQSYPGFGFVHPGFLNKVYVRMSQIAPGDGTTTTQSLFIHTGAHVEGDVGIELQSLVSPTSAGETVVGGTEGDGSEIRVRPEYKWEGIYGDSLRSEGRPALRLRNRLAVWFGFTPLRKKNLKTSGVAFDVKLVNGHYVTISEDDDL